MFSLESILKVLQLANVALAQAPAFVEVYDQIVATFSEDDQATLKEAYADLIADNDEGHARLQRKLAAAAKL